MAASVLLTLPATITAETPAPGGQLTVAQRSAPRTLNPVFALDEPSRTAIGLFSAPLIRLNPVTQKMEGVLAESWYVSPDARRITLQLRDGLRFSDGAPLTLDDVLFTFEVHLDARTASPQRDLLIVGGSPVQIERAGPRSLRLILAQPYGPRERLIAGFSVLPKHLLGRPFAEGNLAAAWHLNTPAAAIAGAGPFRVQSSSPDGRIVFERNPHYWKRDASGRKLPYLDSVILTAASGEDTQVTRFRAGEADLIAGLSGSSYLALSRSGMQPAPQLTDAGASFDYTFLLFNLNPRPDGPSWLKSAAFRRAVSLAADRAAMVRLVYHGRATAIHSHVTPARREWTLDAPVPRRSLDEARSVLKSAGFQTGPAGRLTDSGGKPVTMSIVVNSANPAHAQIAAILQEDLRQIGIETNVVPLEFRSLVDRVMKRRDFDTAVMALRPGDADPVADINVLTSAGTNRLWNMSGKPLESWEAEIDRLMTGQLGAATYKERKSQFDRVQQILAEQYPFVSLVSPNVLAAARSGLRNFRPAAGEAGALWNADEMYWGGGMGRR
jgi:peptide/nickel transport system substrate-binding protein